MSCKICGNKSGIYPLCPDCFKLRDEGKIAKCEECNEWHYTNEACKCKKKIVKNLPKDDLKCKICGADSNGKEVCKTCFYEIINKQEELDRNQMPWELKDYFYNLNSSIYRLKENTYAIGQIYKLYAIAWLVRDIYKDNQLSDIVGTYTTKLLKFRKEKLSRIKTYYQKSNSHSGEKHRFQE